MKVVIRFLVENPKNLSMLFSLLKMDYLFYSPLLH